MGEKIWAMDWQGIFVPEYSLLEMVVRGTIMYLLVFVLVRLMSKRQIGGLGPSDVLVIVLLAEVAGNGFTASDYRSVSEGAVLVATVLGWTYALNWLGNRFPVMERLIRGPKLKLVENGQMLRRNMQAELVTREELLAQMREKGFANCEDVAAAYMEADGRISIIKRKGG